MLADISKLISDASPGDIEAQIQLADLYESGFDVSVDLDQAAYWYRRSAEAGSAIAQNKLGQYSSMARVLFKIIHRRSTGFL